MYTQFKISVP